jgi:hypothetical protein
MRIGLVGRGIVGERFARRLATVVDGGLVVDVDPRRPQTLAADVEAVVLAHPAPHAPLAAEYLERGVHVVSVSAELGDVRELGDLDDLAVVHDATLVVGAGMSPGLSGLLARYLADRLTVADEIHVAFHGTAGPACARHQHRALRGRAVGLHDGRWITRQGGSGRELCYFPEPVGPYDCYRAELASPVLLNASFPDAVRISERVSANRRDRFTAWLPMLTPPHREGGVGAVRVEVRGTDPSGARVTHIAGAAELVATASAAVALAFVAQLSAGRLPVGVVRPGDADLDTVALLGLATCAGVRLQQFTGVPSLGRVRANP